MNALFGRSNNDPNDNTARGASWAFDGRYRQFIKLTDVVEPAKTGSRSMNTRTRSTTPFSSPIRT
jgi:hypothetical protein